MKIEELVKKAQEEKNELGFNQLFLDHISLIIFKQDIGERFLVNLGIDPEEFLTTLKDNLIHNQIDIEHSFSRGNSLLALKQFQSNSNNFDHLVYIYLNEVNREIKRNKLENNVVFLKIFLESFLGQTISGSLILKIYRITPEKITNELFNLIYVKSNSESEETKGLSFLTNLNKLAKNKKIDPVIGRDEEIERVIEILLRRKKNNPVLVGEPGVGKTAIAQGLALKIVEKTVPNSLKDATIYSLDIGGMIAGTKFRGEAEKRLKDVIKKVKSDKNGILFFDEIHNMRGAGSAEGSMDVSNLLKPELASGELKVIGATTYKEFRNVIEKDPALTRRFRKVDVKETNIYDTKTILAGLKEKYEKFHKVKYSLESINQCVELATKYITGKYNPDKSIDVMDEVGAHAKKMELEKVSVDLVEEIIAKLSGVPRKNIESDYSKKLKDLKNSLDKVIYGQDDAIDELVKTVEINFAGLGDENKPIGSFLFVGPTGVGKTELVKQLSENLGLPMTRLDMSEFGEKHTVSKLIGPPPGFVGYDQEGMLTEAVIKNPNSIILLDEIEKAHPEIYNILLQVLDYGTLKDSHGRIANFKNSIIIMTSNIGASIASKNRIGFDDTKDLISTPKEEIKKYFSPEFLNRLDKIIKFNPLSKDIVEMVLDKNLDELRVDLLKKNITFKIKKSVREKLLKDGFDPLMGARPMQRAIKDNLREILAPEILYGRLKDGGEIEFGLKNGSVYFVKKEIKEPITIKK